MTSRNPATRSGRFIAQRDDYRAFVPKPLPPDPPLHLDQELFGLLEDAGTELGRLDGFTKVSPDPKFFDNVFVSIYLRREAALSSQIEGTQSTLEDLFARELGQVDDGSDVLDIVNYLKAMDYGLNRLEELPLSLRLIREIHAQLVQDTRGSGAAPGEFRAIQNWICTTSSFSCTGTAAART
jgi:cell filamentation protein, protein adenylyltransferase